MNRYMPLVILVVLGQTILAYILVDNLVVKRLAGPPQETLREIKTEIALSDEPDAIYRDLGEFLFNPADTLDTEGFRFVQTEITLGVSPSHAVNRLKDMNPRLRDTIIGILSSKRLDEMNAPVNREFIKDELRFALNEYLAVGEILQVYITKFIIQ